MCFLKFRKRSDASSAYALVAMRTLALMLEPAMEFVPSNVRDARMQKNLPGMLAPVIERLLHSAYSQCGIQRVGVRYYPLAVDEHKVPGERTHEVPERLARLTEAFEDDFGPHPLGKADPTSADVRTVISLAIAEKAAGRSSAAVNELLKKKEEIQRRGKLTMTVFKGGHVHDDATLHLSYGRCFVENGSLRGGRMHFTFTLEPGLVWNWMTREAPWEEVLPCPLITADDC